MNSAGRAYFNNWEKSTNNWVSVEQNQSTKRKRSMSSSSLSRLRMIPSRKTTTYVVKIGPYESSKPSRLLPLKTNRTDWTNNRGPSRFKVIRSDIHGMGASTTNTIPSIMVSLHSFRVPTIRLQGRSGPSGRDLIEGDAQKDVGRQSVTHLGCKGETQANTKTTRGLNLKPILTQMA